MRDEFILQHVSKNVDTDFLYWEFSVGNCYYNRLFLGNKTGGHSVWVERRYASVVCANW